MKEIVNKEWINEERVQYFNILEFVSKIKLNDNVLYHMEETGLNFEKYLKTLFNYCNADDYSIVFYLLELTSKELKQSSLLENKTSRETYAIDDNLFFDKLSISHERIKDIHRFVCEKGNLNVSLDYRKTSVNVGASFKDGYQVYWYAPEAKDVKAFMTDYIQFYKYSSIADIYNNPFLNSALAHLLFVRIHPFEDGNGRTARIIQNIAFTSRINKIYGTNLRISPINISQNIVLNKYRYVDIIDRIHFNLQDDNNDMLNKWFDFILNMYDEQLYFQENQIPKYEQAFKELQSINDSKDIVRLVRKFNLDKLKRIQ